MSKYEFIFHKDENNPFSITKVTMEVDTDYMPDLLETFREFLSACGFAIDFRDEVVLEKFDEKEE